MKRHLISLISITALVFAVALGSTTFADAQSNKTDHTPYTTSAQCFDCHGSYAEHAETTAQLGDWNPHKSIHGGYVDCMNCHTQDKLTKNYCEFCHAYKGLKK